MLVRMREEPSPEFGGADAGDDARAPLGSVCGYTHVWRCCLCSLRLPLEGFGIVVGGADIDRASGPVRPTHRCFLAHTAKHTLTKYTYYDHGTRY